MALKLRLFLTPNHASSLQLDSPMAFFQASDQEAKLASTRGTVLSLPAPVLPWRRAPRRGHVIRCASGEVRTFKKQKTAKAEAVQVKAIVSVKHDHYTAGGFLTDVADLFGKSLLLELVSTKTDPTTELEKDTITAYAHKIKERDDEVKYEAKFTVPRNFGQIGAVLVTNKHDRELFLKEIFLTGQDDTPITIECNSWVHTYKDNSEKRVFFHNKSYLPSQTPKGLETLRKKELENLRGDGLGERKWFETIYDYDVYNDLGSPDSSPDLARPVLGGKDLPYPRRCRTGRPRTKKDPKSESRNDFIYYVPRDEAFSGVKWATFGSKTVGSVLRSVLPSLVHANLNDKHGFPFFTAIDSLFNEGVNLPKVQDTEGINHIPRLLKALAEGAGQLRFETPEMIDRDKFSWFRDEEFSRQTLAGLNPYSIELVTEFPFVSKLDPEIYGPPESAITAELIESEIKGVMTVEEAIKQKKLFIIDYHDLLLPYVNKVRELKGTTLYGSRTLFFLTHDETLMPIAIELTRPASPTKPQWKQVFTDSWDATGAWLWKLAKVHVTAHDSGYHQLVIHWLRTHCCTEPYIIAAHRQLSGMHPIFRLLHPYFRYTMEINALAREALINANGVIEKNFSPGKYSIELSSVAYDKLWRFDTQSFPGDLIKRGMAVEDPTAEHGLRLTINDYPFASDGLLLWSAIKQWVSDYVGHFYQDSSSVTSDNELQAWWTEVRTRGHEDKKDEPWWPSLNTASDLTEIITTIIWVTSGHHAAVNFGQYHYAGYFPNRPTIARSNMPVEDGEEDHELFSKFWKKPEQSLMECFPSQMQAVQVMAVLDVLSTHSEEEEYIGKEQFAWTENAVINAAFERFRGRLLEIEGIIDARNADPKLKNRCGAGIVPYELLKPSSEPGVTGMGVPNSISI